MGVLDTIKDGIRDMKRAAKGYSRIAVVQVEDQLMDPIQKRLEQMEDKYPSTGVYENHEESPENERYFLMRGLMFKIGLVKQVPQNGGRYVLQTHEDVNWKKIEDSGFLNNYDPKSYQVFAKVFESLDKTGNLDTVRSTIKNLRILRSPDAIGQLLKEGILVKGENRYRFAEGIVPIKEVEENGQRFYEVKDFRQFGATLGYFENLYRFLDDPRRFNLLVSSPDIFNAVDNLTKGIGDKSYRGIVIKYLADLFAGIERGKQRLELANVLSGNGRHIVDFGNVKRVARELHERPGTIDDVYPETALNLYLLAALNPEKMEASVDNLRTGGVSAYHRLEGTVKKGMQYVSDSERFDLPASRENVREAMTVESGEDKIVREIFDLVQGLQRERGYCKLEEREFTECLYRQVESDAKWLHQAAEKNVQLRKPKETKPVIRISRPDFVGFTTLSINTPKEALPQA